MDDVMFIDAPLSDGSRARVWVGATAGIPWAVIEAHGQVSYAPSPHPMYPSLPASVSAALGHALTAAGRAPDTPTDEET